MMHMRRFPEAQPVLSQIEHIAVLHALERPRVVPLRKIDPRTDQAASQHRLWCLRNEASHSAAFVGFKVRNNDIAEPRGIEHLGNRCTDISVHRESAGVNERRCVIVDQKLIEANPLLGSKGRDAIDAADQMIYACHLQSASRSSTEVPELTASAGRLPRACRRWQSLKMRSGWQSDPGCWNVSFGHSQGQRTKSLRDSPLRG